MLSKAPNSYKAQLFAEVPRGKAESWEGDDGMRDEDIDRLWEDKCLCLCLCLSSPCPLLLLLLLLPLPFCFWRWNEKEDTCAPEEDRGLVARCRYREPAGLRMYEVP